MVSDLRLPHISSRYRPYDTAEIVALVQYCLDHISCVCFVPVIKRRAGCISLVGFALRWTAFLGLAVGEFWSAVGREAGRSDRSSQSLAPDQTGRRAEGEVKGQSLPSDKSTVLKQYQNSTDSDKSTVLKQYQNNTGY